MTARVILLGLNALMFIVFGLGFMFDPATVTPMFLGVPAPAGDLLVDMRATYGGLSMALGLFMAYSIYRREHLYQGLLVSFLVAIALFASRAIAIAAEASVGQAMYQSVILELVMTILFGWLFFARKKL